MKLSLSRDNFKIKKLLYPLIVLVFFLLAAGLFTLTIQFLLAGLDRAQNVSDQDIQSKILSVDLTSFEAVAGKLGIPLPSATVVSPEDAPQPPPRTP